MILFLILLISVFFAVFFGLQIFLRGPNLSQYDTPIIPVHFRTDPTTDARAQADVFLQENFINPASVGTAKQQLAAKRQRFANFGLTRLFDAIFTKDTAIFNGIAVPGEWTMTKGANPDHRILYLHGGGFSVGGSLSHRNLAVQISQRTGCVVFTPDYKLIPEHTLLDAVYDCRAAYSWILGHGPHGPSPVQKIYVAGDSAGGQMSLGLCQWARDHHIVPPLAVVAISPLTDWTLTGPSVTTNSDTDLMIRTLITKLLALPRWLVLLILWRRLGVRPNHIAASPIFGKLHDLPPTLIHVSASEMLYDDARRYVNKAATQGSNIHIQTWENMPHVWHFFDDILPESNHALDEVAKFIKSHP